MFEAPAAIVVITAADIKQRGYTSLAEVIVDTFPGSTRFWQTVSHICMPIREATVIPPLSAPS